MKIEKTVKELGFHCNNCDNPRRYDLFMKNITLGLCKDCFQELKSLELPPKEPTYEWQYCYSSDYFPQSYYEITKCWYTNDAEFLKAIGEQIRSYFKLEESKRLNEKN